MGLDIGDICIDHIFNPIPAPMIDQKIIWSASVCIFSLLLSFNTQAQGPPIFTETPIMLGLDGGGVRTFGKYIFKENATVYVHPVAIPFNINSKWQVGGIVPFVKKAPKELDNRFGLADVKLFAKYQVHQKDGKGKTFRTLIKLTESLPTGNTSDAPPLGSGDYQTTIGLVSGYITIKYGIYGEVAYNLTSNGLPDNLIYNLAFGYPLLPQKYPPKQINLFLELNGNLLTDTNSNSLFISPGVQYIVGKRLLFETGIQLPIVEDMPDAQKTNFMYTLGTRVLIF
jgi:outer membrane putative beta-barrel porin/alpha-amylase